MYTRNTNIPIHCRTPFTDAPHSLTVQLILLNCFMFVTTTQTLTSESFIKLSQYCALCYTSFDIFSEIVIKYTHTVQDCRYDQQNKYVILCHYLTELQTKRRQMKLRKHFQDLNASRFCGLLAPSLFFFFCTFTLFRAKPIKR